MSGYRIEVSPNNRAGCQDTVCKANGDKITKGMLRFGTWVEIMGHGSWRWKHWGCVSGAQLKSVREGSASGDGYDWDAIDGYDEMGDHPDLQEKIRTAVEEGHIAPEDFNGDPEFNVLGQRAIRSRSAVKAGKEGEDPAEAEAKGTTPKKTPAKKTPAKRGRKAVDDDDDEADETPTTKRAKKAAVKAEPATAPRPRGRPRKSAVKAESEEEEEEEEEEAAPAAAAPRRGRPRKSVVKPEPEADEEEEEAAPAPAPRGRGRPRKSVTDAADLPEATQKPKRAARKSKGSA